MLVCISLFVLALSACGEKNGTGEQTQKTDKTATKAPEGESAKNTAGAANPTSAGSQNLNSQGSDFPFGLIRIADTGNGKVVFIIDTTLIDDDLSGVVECDMNFDDYSVTYKVWKENSVNCDIIYHYDENGKHKGRTVVRGEYVFKDGKFMITFPAEDVYALGDFKYGDFENGDFYVFRDNARKVLIPFTESDLIVNDETAKGLAGLLNDYGIGYKSSTFDLQYFTPKTDDFIITAWDNADPEGKPTQTNALFSFDATGKCVQYAARIDIPVDTDLGIIDVSVLTGENGYYRDYTGDANIYNSSVNGDKAMVLYYLSKDEYIPAGHVYSAEGYREGSRMYCSKPLDSATFSNTKSRDDVLLDMISSYLGDLHVGSDYLAWNNEKETFEEFVELRSLIIDGKPVFDQDTYQWKEQEYSWPEVSWDNIVVEDFDKDGYNVNQYSFFIFEDSELIPSWLYRREVLHYKWEHPEEGVLRYAEYESASPIAVRFEGDYMDFLDDRWVRVSDNVLCLINTRGGTHKFPGSDFFYYSIPAVTEEQLGSLGMIWEYKTFK